VRWTTRNAATIGNTMALHRGGGNRSSEGGAGAGAGGGAGAGAGVGAPEDASKKGWLARYGATIIGNLQLTVTNVHIRYEDDLTTPGHPFAGVGARQMSLATS